MTSARFAFRCWPLVALMPLLLAQTTKHREHVIVEYAPNDEVMIRDPSAASIRASPVQLVYP